MAKFIISKHRAINLSNIDEVSVSCNYLKITTSQGRIINFVYGTDDALESLFEAIMDFMGAENPKTTFDCDEFISNNYSKTL